MSAWAQGFVRPVWLHGSSETTIVAPRAAPAGTWESASTSACAVPAPRCQPSAMTSPAAERSTAPTCGLRPRGPRAARANARSIAAASAGVAVIRSSSVSNAAEGNADGATRMRDARAASHPDSRRSLVASPSVPEFHRIGTGPALSDERSRSRTVTAGSDSHRPRSTVCTQRTNAPWDRLIPVY